MRIPDHRLDAGIHKKLELYLAKKYMLSEPEARKMRLEHGYKGSDLKSFYYGITRITPADILQCGIDFATEGESMDPRRAKGDPKFSRRLLYRLLEKKVTKKADIDILLCLAGNQNKLGECCITASWLGDAAGMSHPRVLKHLHFLEEKGIIDIKRLQNYRYIVTIPDNTFEEHYRYQDFYADLRRSLFHTEVFRNLNGPAKLLILAALSTDEIGQFNRCFESRARNEDVSSLTYYYPLEYQHAKRIWTRYMTSYAFDSGIAQLCKAGLLEKTTRDRLDDTDSSSGSFTCRRSLTRYRHAPGYVVAMIKICGKDFKRIRHKDDFVLAMHLTDIVLRAQKITLDEEELVEATKAMIRGDSELRKIMEKIQEDKRVIDSDHPALSERKPGPGNGLEKEEDMVEGPRTAAAKDRLFAVGSAMVFSEYKKGRYIARKINHDQMLLSPFFMGKKTRLLLGILIKEIKALIWENGLKGSAMIRKAADHAIQTIYCLSRNDSLYGYPLRTEGVKSLPA